MITVGACVITGSNYRDPRIILITEDYGPLITRMNYRDHGSPLITEQSSAPAPRQPFRDRRFSLIAEPLSRSARSGRAWAWAVSTLIGAPIALCAVRPAPGLGRDRRHVDRGPYRAPGGRIRART